jgi:hypothetical protein
LCCSFTWSSSGTETMLVRNYVCVSGEVREICDK